jgi:hypothetical protein
VTPPAEQPRATDLAALAEELAEQAAEIRRQWGELAGALGVEGPADLEVQEAPEIGVADPARLVALDMLLAGHGRDEVAAHLAQTFGEEHAGKVTREVFAEFEP